MSSSFDPIQRNQSDWVSKHFNCALPDSEWKDRISINDAAPFIYLEDGITKCELGSFGIIPPWTANRKKTAAYTYTVKSESVQENGLYRMPWQQRKFGLVLANRFYEPLYDQTGSKFSLTPISRTDEEPIALACIWNSFFSRAIGGVIRSFSLLTVNAENHSFLNRFYRSRDEKRAVVVIENTDTHKWLNATHEQATALIKPCSDGYLDAHFE